MKHCVDRVAGSQLKSLEMEEYGTRGVEACMKSLCSVLGLNKYLLIQRSHTSWSNSFLSFFSRVPEIELKNAKGLSNESVNLLKSHLEKVAKKHCGEVRYV